MKMRLSDRLILSALALAEGTRVGNALGAFFANRYEAGLPSAPQRSILPGFVEDHRYEANSYTRWEMLRKIRYLYKNCFLVKAMRKEHVKWTVGAGLNVIPTTSNEDFNKRMLDAYSDWCKKPCVDSNLTLGQVHKQIAGTHFLENEAFILKTFTKLNGKPKRPAIQLVANHRISSPGHAFNQDQQDDLIDGVQMGRDALGRIAGPVGYWVLEGDTGGNQSWVLRSVDDMIQIIDPDIVGTWRDVSRFHPVMDTLHDFSDLEMMEMQRAKQNSEVSNVLTNATGEISQEQKRLRRFGLTSNPSGPEPNTREDEIDKRLQVYRKIMGARTIALKKGETFEQFTSESPTASQQWYYKYKMAQIAGVAGVPVILVLPEIIETIQGTVVRGIYDNAHKGFRDQFEIYAAAAIDVYQYFAKWAVYNVPGLYDPPADWQSCHVTPPRAVNVDVGNNSNAQLLEFYAGVTNLSDIAGSRGTTARALLTKKAQDVWLAKKIAQEQSKGGITVEPAEVLGNLALIAQQLAQAQGGNEDEDEDEGNEPEPKPAKKPKKEPANA